MRGGGFSFANGGHTSPWRCNGSFRAEKSPGESPEQALARELREELGIEASVGPRVTHVRHNYRHGGAVDLQFFAVREFSGDIENRIFAQVRWTRLEDLPSYDFLAADRGLIRDLASGKLL